MRGDLGLDAFESGEDECTYDAAGERAIVSGGIRLDALRPTSAARPFAVAEIGAVMLPLRGACLGDPLVHDLSVALGPLGAGVDVRFTQHTWARFELGVLVTRFGEKGTGLLNDEIASQVSIVWM